MNPNKKQPPAQYVREPRAPGIRPSGRLLYLEVAAGRAGGLDGVAVLDRVTRGRTGHNGKDAQENTLRNVHTFSPFSCIGRCLLGRFPVRERSELIISVFSGLSLNCRLNRKLVFQLWVQ